MYHYDERFYEYISRGSKRSAELIVPHILKYLAIESVADIGCGAGAWLQVWKAKGADVLGVDGDYVDRSSLFIDKSEFIARDLTAGFDLGRRFSLVQSLEVAEHLPEASADRFVQALCSHGDYVLFSAAPPGQGGDNHINERPYEYWRKKFEANGFVPLDLIRAQFLHNKQIEPWYRYNSFLYVKKDVLDSLSDELKQFHIEGEISDLSPAGYRFRKLLVRSLPIPIATKAAKVKENVFVMIHRVTR